MATYLDEIKNETLYRRKFFLPINEKDKRHNSLIFLLSNSFLGSYELRNNPFAINTNRSFISYYMEPSVSYYMNIRENTLISEFEESILIDEFADINEDSLLMESADDKNYGIPELKKFPMPDAKHVKSAIKFFNYVDSEHEEELANAIKRNIKKFGITGINVGSKNRFSKYVKNMKQVTIKESFKIPEAYSELLEESVTDGYNNKIINEVHLDKKFNPEFNLSEDSFMLSYNEADEIIDEASKYDSKLKMMLYKDRIRNNKEA